MYSINNQVYVGLLTDIRSNKLQGHRVSKSTYIKDGYLEYYLKNDYPYSQVAVWYGKDNINVDDDFKNYKHYLMLVNVDSLSDYGINLNQIMHIPRHYNHFFSYGRRGYSWKSHVGSFGVNALKNDDKVKYEEEITEMRISGRNRNKIYKGLEAQLDWDLGDRTRIGSWKDKKIRHQWQKHATGDKLYRNTLLYTETNEYPVD